MEWYYLILFTWHWGSSRLENSWIPWRRKASRVFKEGPNYGETWWRWWTSHRTLRGQFAASGKRPSSSRSWNVTHLMTHDDTWWNMFPHMTQNFCSNIHALVPYGSVVSFGPLGLVLRVLAPVPSYLWHSFGIPSVPLISFLGLRWLAHVPS